MPFIPNRHRLKSYFELMRFHKPIGTFLLLWPTWWALWIAARGFPSIKNFIIFTLGVVVMRAAGCVINDFADRDIDSHVSRTKSRPITSGNVTPNHALILFFILCLIGLTLVLFTNRLTIVLSIFALMTATIYPFMKRYTHWPQLILGIAFSFSIPMAFAAETNTLPLISFLLMLANIFWTIAYDTTYAMVDRQDDLKIGIKSTAILFGKYDQWIIGLFQIMSVLLLFFIGIRTELNGIYFLGLLISILLFLYQQKWLSTRLPENYFRAFLNNNWVGLVVFLGIWLATEWPKLYTQ
jgi:4-hydroxybenzoate polyprenyltransferase